MSRAITISNRTCRGQRGTWKARVRFLEQHGQQDLVELDLRMVSEVFAVLVEVVSFMPLPNVLGGITSAVCACEWEVCC